MYKILVKTAIDDETNMGPGRAGSLPVFQTLG